MSTEDGVVQAWITEISANPLLVTRAVEEGLYQLGYESIKPEQLTAVENLLKGDDVFISIPTGFGKSLVYQLLLCCSVQKAYSVPVNPHRRSNHLW